MKQQFDQLKQKLNHDKLADLEKNKAEIIRLLEMEIAKRYYFQRASYEMASRIDEDVQEALKLFNDPTKYKQLLNRK